jgi:cation transport regulator ChaB
MPEKGSEAERIEEDRLPSTLDRSDQKAKDTYAETLASAEESYGDGRRAHQTAWAAVKHTHEKVGDHWEPKESYGPSDAQAAGGWRRRERVQAAPVRAGAAGGDLGPLDDEQGRAGRRPAEVQRPEDGRGPRGLTRVTSVTSPRPHVPVGRRDYLTTALREQPGAGRRGSR